MMKRILETGLLLMLALSVLCSPVVFADELEMSNWVLIDGQWLYMDMDGMLYAQDPYGLTLPPDYDASMQQFEPEPAPTPKRKPKATPKPKRTRVPALEEAYELSPDLSFESAPELEYQPAPELEYPPASEPIFEPAPELEYQPAPEPRYEPAPELGYEPAPELEHQPASEPIYEPAPELEHQPASEPGFELAPELGYEPAPEPTDEPAPETELEAAPDSAPEEAPEPLSVTIHASYGGSEPRVGDTVRLESVVEGAKYGESLHYLWQFRAPGGDWMDIIGANGDAYSYVADEVNAGYVWRLIVTRQ